MVADPCGRSVPTNAAADDGNDGQVGGLWMGGSVSEATVWLASGAYRLGDVLSCGCSETARVGEVLSSACGELGLRGQGSVVLKVGVRVLRSEETLVDAGLGAGTTLLAVQGQCGGMLTSKLWRKQVRDSADAPKKEGKNSQSFIPVPCFIRSRRPTPFLAPSLVLFPPCSA